MSEIKEFGQALDLQKEDDGVISSAELQAVIEGDSGTTKKISDALKDNTTMTAIQAIPGIQQAVKGLYDKIDQLNTQKDKQEALVLINTILNLGIPNVTSDNITNVDIVTSFKEKLNSVYTYPTIKQYLAF